MRKLPYILVLMICFAQQANAALPSIEVSNFRADYLSPEGSAQADVFVYEGDDYGADAQFNLYQQAGDFVLVSEREEFRVGPVPEQIYNWKSVSLKRVDLVSTPNSVSLKSERIEYVSDKGEAGYVSGVEIQCENPSKNDIVETVLDLCINKKMDFYLPFIGGVGFNNINIWTNNNKFDFSLKNKIWIKGYGEVFYYPSEGLIKLRLDKARAGILNVTGRVFSELEKLENNYLKVNRPWVEITLPAI
ncbi:MAG: hypothetical protein KC478_04565 [Bacteriovoracaceae bacterium]|nr:hypothetical protein [Bacteriovoracaceae bacterium]